jgi:sec-independent protein translocase protein TatA
MGLDNPIHIAFLLILLLLVFGAKRLPEMGKSLGTGMRGFKDALSGDSEPTALVAPQQDASVTATSAAGAQAAPQPLQVAPQPVGERLPA